LPGRRYRQLVFLGVLAAAITASVDGVPALANAAPLHTALTNATPSSSARFAADNAQLVTLVTGDRVLVGGTSARPSFAPEPAPGSGGFESFTDAGGDHYVVPSVAMPYLGRQLDPSLFDVSAQVRDGAAVSGRIPVDATFDPGITPTAPAGMTFTSVSGSTATGYLTATSGSDFAAALRGQIGADIAAGHQAGSGTVFGGLASLSLAGATGANPNPTVGPLYAQHILQITSTDNTGAPTAGAVILLINTDLASREVTYVPITNGLDRVAVPAGHYAAMTAFSDFDAQGNPTGLRLVAADNITVPDSGTTPTTVALNELSATAAISATTPQPTTERVANATLAVLDSTGAGQAISITNIGEAQIPVQVSPMPASTSGTAHYVAQWSGIAPKPTDGYQYDLAVGASGIPANQAIVAEPNQLATVKERFYADPAGGTSGGIFNGPVDPSLLLTSYSEFGNVATMPGVLTDYLGTGDGGEWGQQVQTPNGILLFADPHSYAAGRTYSVDWAHGPVASGLGQWTSPQICEACVAGSTLSLAIPRSRDSVADHTGTPWESAPTHFTLYQGSTKVFDQNNYYGAVVTGIPLVPTTYRGVLDFDLTGVRGFSQATKTHTEETVHYSPTASAPLPGTDTCDATDATAVCEVLPAVTLDYQLASDGTNTSTLPVQVLGLRVGHVSYNGVGSHTPISSVTVAVSFDNGGTWQRVPVLGAVGDYVAVWSNPASAAGTTPSLQVSATDAAGNQISQTITNAYTIGKQA